MKHQHRVAALFALVLALLLVLGVAPALAAPAQSLTGITPDAAVSAPASVTSALGAPSVFTAVGISSPPCPPEYDFSGDADGSAPTSYPLGTFTGINRILVVGTSANECPYNGWPLGTHVAYTTDGVTGITVTFKDLQSVVGVSALPALWWTSNGSGMVPYYFDVTITAFDRKGCTIGTYTVNMSGVYGPQFIGLKSCWPCIASVQITAEADAHGLAFTDLTCRPGHSRIRGH